MNHHHESKHFVKWPIFTLVADFFIIIFFYLYMSKHCEFIFKIQRFFFCGGMLLQDLSLSLMSRSTSSHPFKKDNKLKVTFVCHRGVTSVSHYKMRCVDYKVIICHFENFPCTIFRK